MLRVASALLAVGALALFWLAFTQFDATPAQTGSTDSSAYEDAMIRDARLSIVWGLAGCFTLLGAFACLNAAQRRRAVPPAAPDAP